MRHGATCCMNFPSPEVFIIREPRKTLSAQVSASGIIVKVPLRAAADEIAQFLASQEDWLRLRWQRRNALWNESSPSIYWEGVLLALREDRRLPARQFQVDLSSRIFFVSDLSARSILVSRAYHAKTRQLFDLECRRLQLSAPVSIKRLSSCWGRCHSDGRIDLHPLISALPSALSSYVISHELAHLTHMNHSASFWQLCHRYCSGAKKLDQELNLWPLS